VPSKSVHVFKTNIENTIDMVAKGYFSEPEHVGFVGAAKLRVLKKLKSQDKPRSKSLTKKEKPASMVDTIETDCAKPQKEKKEKVQKPKIVTKEKAQKSKATVKSKGKPEGVKEVVPASSTHNLVNINNNTIKAVTPAAGEPVEPVPAKSPKKVKTIATISQTKTKKKSKEPEKPDVNTKKTSGPNERVASPLLVESAKLDDTMESTDDVVDVTNNNNNNETEPKTVQNMNSPEPQIISPVVDVPEKGGPIDDEKAATAEEEEEEHQHTKVPAARKRSKSRSSKFSSRKRHRTSMLAEVEQIVAPRKSTSAPRWSNGWSWEGSSFQGKVFLNVSLCHLVDGNVFLIIFFTE
jgi:hypothetical protein